MKIEHVFNAVIDSSNADFYYLACSGGVDSMVLLHLAKNHNIPIHVLHVNYNLRGIDSIKDEEFIEEFCTENKIPISIHKVQLKERIEKNGGNLQNEARKIRYDFFRSKLNQVENSKLLIAHHQDDQIETFWLQLYRGSGLKGMAGMEKLNSDFLRPILDISKKELFQYAKLNGIDWREDKSNSSVDYQRNLWRNEFIPFLNKEIPTITDSLSFIQHIFKENLDEILLKTNKVINEIKYNNYIELNLLSDFNITEIIEIFRALSIPIHLVNTFLNLFQSQKGSRIKWRNSLGIFEEITREENGFSFSRIDKNNHIPILKTELFDILPKIFDKTCFYYDLNKIKGQIKLRYWQKGDRIYPIGMRGSKLISDVITNAKIPNAERNNQLVICDDEKILACIGLCVDRRAIANEKSSIIRVSLQN